MLSYIINKDGNPVPVKIIGGEGSGGITGKNVENDEQINEVSFLMDEEGYPVLRTIDAAPFAYNVIKDALDVNIKGKSVEKERIKEVFTLEPGAAKVFETINVTEHNYLSWGVSADTAHQHRLELIQRDFEDDAALHRLDRDKSPFYETFSLAQSLTAEIQLQTTGVRLTVRNLDTVSHNYTAYVYLRK